MFAGAARVSSQDAELTPPPNLRMLAIPAAGENVGVRKLGVRRVGPQGANSDSWEAYVGLRNDGLRPREVELTLAFGGTQAGSKTLTLEPGAESQTNFTFHARQTGLVEAKIRTTNGRGDSFPQDDRAVIELTIHEGRNRQVRRMCEAVGHPVRRLVRTRVGPLRATGVGPGTWRRLGPEEIVALVRHIGSADESAD